jgi:hypothetical protein
VLGDEDYSERKYKLAQLIYFPRVRFLDAINLREGRKAVAQGSWFMAHGRSEKLRVSDLAPLSTKLFHVGWALPARTWKSDSIVGVQCPPLMVLGKVQDVREKKYYFAR